MACLICGADVETVQPIGDFHERNCTHGCGRYRVADTLAVTMRKNSQKFDVQKTRQWLAVNRVTEPVPKITTSTAIYA